ncbi:MAG: DUF1553 domain-containing protein, partial [Verrucomicrobiota bacterium]
LGEKATHPELLDWLAATFMETNWSMKDMHRLIMNSAAYQRSSSGQKEGLASDPQNNLFWRFNMRRLTAEEIRDSMLAVSGRLNLKAGGPSFFPEMPEAVLATSSTKGGKWGNSPEEEQRRRTIYSKIKRSLQHPQLVDFDFADTDSACAVRFTTTVPTQALNMLNGKFVNDQAKRFAERLSGKVGHDPRKVAELGMKLVANRPATEEEITHCEKLARDLRENHQLKDEEITHRLALVLLNLNEFVYLD